MNILIVTDQRFILKNGKYYTEQVFYNNLKRYKLQFENVSIYAKTGHSLFESSTEVEGFDIYLGGDNISLYMGKNIRKFEEIIPNFDLLILRVPSVLSIQAAKIAKQERIPYMIVSVGCVFDALWNHGLKGKVLAPIMFRKTKDVVKYASYASYVTDSFLQSRYPCSVKSIAVSDVEIDISDRDVLERRLKKIDNMSTKFITMMTAAALNVKYKGQQYVIESIPLLNKKGIHVKYYIAGTGSGKYLLDIAKKYKVSDQVVVLGSVSHDKIISLMDEIDLYIQPSLQEGLPRAVVEALSRACPCVGTAAGGIPELISKECFFHKKSPDDMANIIESLLNKKKLKELAEINWRKSRHYYRDVLDMKRNEYFKYVTESIESSK